MKTIQFKIGKLLLGGLLFLCLPIQGWGQAVNIADNQTVTALMQSLVGSGVAVSNPVLNCAGNANGIFNVVTTSNLDLQGGVVLTTGNAKNNGSAPFGANLVSGTANSSFASKDNGMPGDAQLTNLVGGTTQDACILEFDFVPQGDTISFQYVFGSEEYTDYSCSNFNDVFAFFISGPGITGSKNMAVIPNTNPPIAVSVNSTTGVQATSLCTSLGQGAPFSMYYVDNLSGTSICYNGFTTVLTAASAVTPCQTYHLKMAIADKGDGSYDSGVFLEAGSLTSSSLSVNSESAPGLDGAALPYCIRGCSPGRFIFKRPLPDDTAKVVHYIIQGTAVNGTDYATIPDSVFIPAYSTQGIVSINALQVTPSTGPRTVKLTILSFDCNGTAHIVDSSSMTIYDSVYLKVFTPDTAVCIGGSVPVRAEKDSLVTFTWSPVNGIDYIDSLQPIITPTTTTTYLLTGNIPGSGCPDAVLSLTIDVQPYPTITLSDKEKCIGDTLSIQPGISPPYDHYIYSWSPATFLSAASQANVGYFGTGATTLTLITTTPAGCSDTGSMQVSIFPPNHITSTPADTSLCFGDSVQIFVTADSGTTILWTPAIFLSDTTIFVPVSHPRFSIGYTAMLTDIHGCKDTAVSHIRVYPQAMVNVPDSIVLYPGEQTQLNPQGNCLYFKWFPPLGLSNTSIATPIAMPEVNTRYYLTAQTEWGCIAYDTIDVIIDPETAIDVPNAFAPGNGPNAELKVVKKGVATLKSFCIFNRWGEKVFETLDIEKGWDGRVNGVPQPMGVYVYFVEAYTGNGKRFYKQGNITLLR